MNTKKPAIKTVLLVEDDDVARILTSDVIDGISVNTKVAEAENGEVALQMIKGKLLTFPCLVLLDINMPVMDGFSFLKEFDKLVLDEQVFIAVVTSSLNHQDLERAKKHDIIDYIEKPLTEDKFLNVLNKVS